MTTDEVAFDKYAVKGAYHWTELLGPLHRRNAYTMARYGAVLRALRDCGFEPGARVLDVGCGDAALAGLVAKRLGGKVAGIDTAPLSIELAKVEFTRRGLAGEFAVIDGYVYPFADGSFAAVISSDVIEHVREPARLLQEMWRVLAPGGTAVLTTPVRYTEAPLDRMHVAEWFPSEFVRLCESTFGVPVEIRLSHPLAWSEFYASPAPLLGRTVRILINLAAVLGCNVFASMGSMRVPSTQTVIAIKPHGDNA
jgi:2-polyprenyl-3-methyl-5-hydroxy-6-metoxy-1,4-benzoquinol methylase